MIEPTPGIAVVNRVSMETKYMHHHVPLLRYYAQFAAAGCRERKKGILESEADLNCEASAVNAPPISAAPRHRRIRGRLAAELVIFLLGVMGNHYGAIWYGFEFPLRP